MSALVALAGTVPVVATASPSIYLVPVGESRVYRLERPIKRVAVGNPEVADYIMLNPSELYLLGKKPGATNLIVWDQNGNFTSTPLQVSRNINAIKVMLKVVLPNETDIQIFAWGPALVLAGSVSNTLVADTAYRLVVAYTGGKTGAFNPETTLTNSAPGSSSAPASAPPVVVETGLSGPGVVNLLKVRDPQQVRLEVHIAEISKSYLETLGLDWTRSSSNIQGSFRSGFVTSATLDLILHGNRLQVKAEGKKGLIKILAEPTIVALSGHEGSFLVGGKIYTPTVGANGTVDYVERTYGVGLRFMPTVLDGGRILLKVVPEVSELNTVPLTLGTNTLPSFKISSSSTTVQMKEGENLVIGGLLREKLTEDITRVPLLGDIPILGALFRHTSKSSETTELMVIIRPTLVNASASAPELPTDRFVPPTRKELFIDGKLQGSRVK
jgi:pilus assembly protein CpaC